MELRSRRRNVSLYLTIMIVGTILCNIISFALGVASVEESFIGVKIQWALVILGWLISLAPSIYHIIVMGSAVEDYNRLCGRNNEGYLLESPNFMIVFLLSMVTLGIYGFYWFYKYGNNLKELGDRKGIAIRDEGKAYLRLTLIPCVITWILGLLTVIMFISMLSGAESLDYQAVKSSAAGLGLCVILLMIAGVCNFVMTYVAYAKWLTNLNRITEKEYTDYRNISQTPPEILQAPSAEGSVLIMTGQYKDAVLPVRDCEEIILGRDVRNCHLVFQNEHVSRVHCGIRFDSAAFTYIVTDYSTNGTYVKGGSRLEKGQPVPCRPGTVLVLGKSGEECMLL